MYELILSYKNIIYFIFYFQLLMENPTYIDLKYN